MDCGNVREALVRFTTERYIKWSFWRSGINPFLDIRFKIWIRSALYGEALEIREPYSKILAPSISQINNFGIESNSTSLFPKNSQYAKFHLIWFNMAWDNSNLHTNIKNQVSCWYRFNWKCSHFSSKLLIAAPKCPISF